MKILGRCTQESTRSIRNDLLHSECVVIDGQDMVFIKKDGTRETINEFEAYVLLAHHLDVRIDWDATH